MLESKSGNYGAIPKHYRDLPTSKTPVGCIEDALRRPFSFSNSLDVKSATIGSMDTCQDGLRRPILLEIVKSERSPFKIGEYCRVQKFGEFQDVEAKVKSLEESLVEVELLGLGKTVKVPPYLLLNSRGAAVRKQQQALFEEKEKERKISQDLEKPVKGIPLISQLKTDESEELRKKLTDVESKLESMRITENPFVQLERKTSPDLKKPVTVIPLMSQLKTDESEELRKKLTDMESKLESKRITDNQFVQLEEALIQFLVRENNALKDERDRKKRKLDEGLQLLADLEESLGMKKNI